MTKKEKILGCIFGMIIGDTLAAPIKNYNLEQRKRFLPVKGLIQNINVEQEAQKAAEKFDDPEERLKWVSSKIHDVPLASHYSFYSQQFLLILETLYALNDLDVEYVAQRLLKYSYPRDEYFPLGIYRLHNKNFSDSLQNIANGFPLRVCGVTNTYGDSAFKSMALGLFPKFNPRQLSQKVIDLTLLSHRDILSIASAACFAYTVSTIRHKGFFNADQDLEPIITFTFEAEKFAFERYKDFLIQSEPDKHMISNSLKELKHLKDKPLAEGIKYFEDQNKKANSKINQAPSITGTSMLLFLKEPDNFEKLLQLTFENEIKIGFVAPIVCALSGMINGVDKLPRQYKGFIRDKKALNLLAENIGKEESKPLRENFYMKEMALQEKVYSQKEGRIKEILLKAEEEKPHKN